MVLNRSDPQQVSAVKHYRLTAAPVPLVLVVAQNGIAVGGARLVENAVDRLVSLVPTKAKAEYLRVLNSRHVALVVFSRKTMPLQSPLFTEISKAVRTTKGRVEPVLVDMNDKSEARFMKEWEVDPKAEKPTIIMMNPKGQPLGRMMGAPRAAQLVATSKKRPCCNNPNCKGCK